MSLTGCGIFPPAVREPCGPTPPPRRRRTAEDHPRNAVRGDGRGRAEQVLGPPPRPCRARGRRAELGDQPVAAPSCHSSQATSVVAPWVATVGRAALRLSARHRRPSAALPGEPGRSVEQAVALVQLGGDLPVALVHPHVPQRVGIEHGDGVGDVDVVLDRRHQPVVERQHQVEISALPLGVLAPVVIGGASVSVAVPWPCPCPWPWPCSWPWAPDTVSTPSTPGGASP